MSDVQSEYIFSTHCKANDGSGNDAIVVKEKLHYPDGTQKPNVRIIENFKRPFWVEKKESRGYTQFKEYQRVENLIRGECTQANLSRSVAMALNGYVGEGSWGIEKKSPYVYGCGPTVTSIVGQQYKNKFPDVNIGDNLTNLASLDYETDVTKRDQPIIMGEVTYRGKVYLAAKRDFYPAGTTEEDVRQACMALVPKDYYGQYDYTYEVMFVEREIDVCIELMRKLHELKPDIVGVWNLDFDINKMIDACETANIDPAFLFSDPSVPKKYKMFVYQPAQAEHKTSGGKTKPKAASEKWNKVFAPASFEFICLMALYRERRKAKGSISSYALDYVSKLVIKLSKLKYDKCKAEEGTLQWHLEMQRDHPLAYSAYCVADGLLLERLDEATGDIGKTFYNTIKYSDSARFASGPGRLADEIHFRNLKSGKISGAVRAHEDGLREPFHNSLPSCGGWIMILESELQEDTGRPILKDYPDRPTRAVTFCYDIDIKSAYPTGNRALNGCQENTLLQVCRAKNADWDDPYLMRDIGLNLTAAKTNALHICQRMFNFPELDDLSKLYDERHLIEQGRLNG